MKLQIAIVTLSAFAGLTLGAVTQLGICPWINEKLATAWFDRGKEQLIHSRSKNDEAIAIASFTRAIKSKPDFALAYVFRGLLESDRDAFADDSMAVKLDPKLSAGYNNRAHLKISRGDYDSAILDCNSAIELSPPGEQPYALRADALANRGLLELKLGNKIRAKQDLKEALRLDPTLVEAAQKLAAL
jgi:tetratricopeptide (TPR) repeat protein